MWQSEEDRELQGFSSGNPLRLEPSIGKLKDLQSQWSLLLFDCVRGNSIAIEVSYVQKCGNFDKIRKWINEYLRIFIRKLPEFIKIDESEWLAILEE